MLGSWEVVKKIVDEKDDSDKESKVFDVLLLREYIFIFVVEKRSDEEGSNFVIDLL